MDQMQSGDNGQEKDQPSPGKVTSRDKDPKDTSVQPGFLKDQKAQMRLWMVSALAEALSNTGQSGPSGLQPGGSHHLSEYQRVWSKDSKGASSPLR